MSLESKVKELLNEIQKNEAIDNYVFLSLGKPNVKAQVKLLKNQRYLERDILKQCKQFKKKSGEIPKWIKLDVVTKTQKEAFTNVKKELIETRRNYVDFGVALDNYWNLTFLPEEINANAFIRPDKQNKEMILSEENINNYLRKYTTHKKGYSHRFFENKEVIKFWTKGYILDDDQIFELYEEGYKKGLRKVENLHSEIDDLIKQSVDFLQGMLYDNGRYNYGFSPHFDKEISFYNILRHSSSTYALIEGLTYLNRDIQPVEKAIDYIIDNYIYEVDGKGYVFDDTKNANEIKLGQNASFIFAVCEYLKVKSNDKYLNAAQKVAKGIISMINKDTYETTHVLNYPDLTVKEKFRVIYYDGEASLALLRLYQQDHNEIWLQTVKNLMDRFIANSYWKYHDHWLGYCTNELVHISPEEKYFDFGIKNVSSYLDYIEQRETTFPTFLEMLMATYRLIQKAKETGFEDTVNHLIDEQRLIDVINIRADYQRVGFFYPEVAMYFKNPARILGSFFIKHHGYRVRIDDIEHYISGYVQYQKAFKNN
ncbi:poly (glycerol-phosphate) alpha-glucosyltransferase [Staphylococcus petrasii]|uniref:Poly (Glycerol-phosphate) alpha-glucosyltransferase n=1 Tax=Staphylococcus petrasii TaxID=1276936 RepID=A0A380G1L2_9STAP|nr:poly(glycerol-phosphate) alpha-glucosyltransferase [Staphylococcus petrasii]PNZ28257.1 poly(glycerol-phosphate) alpha-glucosyltransferase [Staphylococcus petrasii]TGE12861.1 poly(glycerol-phosphate) alpha-glucosyltransferase [Staphylococcus petrasii]TGE15365.1 poly(glycerol-phosphate) alpha-glucosyltransferase [Staphylococcus petrasii]SUM45054.1 poly (glycerol-phosphate) alpha-glucosyltransferase [Staphylococcus petrasii]